MNNRKAYLIKYKWVATTMSMGKPGEVEFIIDKSIFSGNNSFQLAAGLKPASSPDKIISIPDGHEAGCANALLVSGDLSTEYDFLTRGWFKIDLK